MACAGGRRSQPEEMHPTSNPTPSHTPPTNRPLRAVSLTSETPGCSTIEQPLHFTFLKGEPAGHTDATAATPFALSFGNVRAGVSQLFHSWLQVLHQRTVEVADAHFLGGEVKAPERRRAHPRLNPR